MFLGTLEPISLDARGLHCTLAKASTKGSFIWDVTDFGGLTEPLITEFPHCHEPPVSLLSDEADRIAEADLKKSPCLLPAPDNLS